MLPLRVYFFMFMGKNISESTFSRDKSSKVNYGCSKCILWWLTFHFLCRGVVPGGVGGDMAPPEFGRSVNPISTRWGRLCPPNNIGTPGFSDLPTALHCFKINIFMLKQHVFLLRFVLINWFTKGLVIQFCFVTWVFR